MTQSAMAIPADRLSARPTRVQMMAYTALALCGVVDGFDLQATGMIAVQLGNEFAVGSDRLGLLFGATAVGLAIGSSVGGLLSDIDARRGLIGALFMVSLCSLLSTLTGSLLPFAGLRFLTGLGMGAVVPLMLLIGLRTGPPQYGSRRVAVLGTGAPVGGLCLGAWMAAAGQDLSWRIILQVGGLATLGVGLLVIMLVPLPEVRKEPGDGKVPISRLFTHGRAVSALLVCLLFLLAIGLLYVQTSWLPYLLRELSFSPSQVGVTMMCWSAGGALGGLVLGGKLRKETMTLLMVIAYGGVALAAILLSLGTGGLLLSSFGVSLLGFFTAGGTQMLYGIAPLFYVSAVRGTGLGLSIAIGRIGAALGPMIVGYVLASGATPKVVPAGIVPVSLLILLLVVHLLRHHQVED
jgi:AAHS family 3-hydroxyphenylpropionic acid transporter